MSKKLAFKYSGKGKGFIKIDVLDKAYKGFSKKDVIKLDLQSETDDICFCLTEEEAIMLSNGLINAVTIKMKKEGRI